MGPDPSGPVDLPLAGQALVVLVGASGSGKSVWAARHFRDVQVVSSDRLRALVGHAEDDLSASRDAFVVLEQIVGARLGRRLTTVVDTLGTDAKRRRAWLAAAHRAGMQSVVVVLDTPASLCHARNRARERAAPATVVAKQLESVIATRAELAEEAWEQMLVVTPDSDPAEPAEVSTTAALSPSEAEPGGRLHGIVLQLSRFPAEGDLRLWLGAMAEAAEASGFVGLALMDHLIQIPQVGRAWEPIPEPWVTLGALAASTTRLHLGTLVTPVTFRAPGITAKAAATLSAIAGGRTFLGVGAGWWEREHAAYGLQFPSAATRLDMLERSIETLRALWSPGTKPYAAGSVTLPETTCYPRPTADIPIIVGGAGRRTVAIAARLGDGCNVPSDEAGLAKVDAFLDHADRVGRPRDELLATVLDLPVVGRDHDDAAWRVERLRGRTPAATYAARHHAGTSREHVDRLRGLRERGITTVFVAPPDLTTPDDVERIAPLAMAWSS